MNPPYQNRPSNVTSQMVDSIYEIISKECKFLINLYFHDYNFLWLFKASSNIGKKRKAKLKQMLRQNLMQGTSQQSVSARQELSNTVMSANNHSFQEALDDFDMPQTIDFSSGGAVINLCESTSVYTSSNCQIFNDFLLSSAAYWHMILVSF